MTSTIPPTLGQTIREDPERKRVLVDPGDVGRAALRAVAEAADLCARHHSVTYESAASAIRAGVDPGDAAAVRAYCAAERDREAAQARAACRAGLIAATDERIPARFAGAVVTSQPVADWVAAVVTEARSRSRVPGCDHVAGGPSLLLTGKVGTGKTHQAYAAIRALAAESVRAGWEFITIADLYGALRPRQGVDSEAEFRRFASARVLVLDDLGSAKPSEWTEDINYRLINARYEQAMPTLITTNAQPPELPERLGLRVASRLCEMATVVPLLGRDHRTSRREGP